MDDSSPKGHLLYIQPFKVKLQKDFKFNHLHSNLWLFNMLTIGGWVGGL